MFRTPSLRSPLVALSLLGGLSAPVLAGPLKVDAAVDTTACATVAVQCSGAGHSYAVASSSNHNPIALRVTVAKKNGLPMTGLMATDFVFSNGIVPAGGGSAVKCSVASCGGSTFADAGNGLYQIYLDRAAAGNWKQGGYAASLQVSDGTNNGTALVTFTIPN